MFSLGSANHRPGISDLNPFKNSFIGDAFGGIFGHIKKGATGFLKENPQLLLKAASKIYGSGIK